MAKTSFFGEAITVGKSVLKGLSITFKEMWFRDPVTVHYPEETPEVAAWFRGIPLLKTDLATGEYKCTSCGLCVEACPVNVITLEWHQDKETKKKVADRYAIDMSRCMLCNYCIEVCPFDALVMGYDYELCKVDPENMVYEMEELLRLGIKYCKAEEYGPKAAAKKQSVVPPWVFAELTGASEDDILDKKGYLGRPPLPKGYVPEFREEFLDRPGVREVVESYAPPAPKNETKAPEAPAVTKDTPTQTPPVNATPENASAEAGPAKISAPKAGTASGEEAGEVRPDQATQSDTPSVNGKEEKS
jgi:NADH-quinone oxidoreductase subunit I